jgi:predicted nucleic acid-binding protein
VRFVDTNVLLYAISSDPAEADKAERATALLNEPDLALSVQVMQEFYVQATRTSDRVSLPHDTAVAFIETLERFPVQDISLELMRSALSTSHRWRVSYWDAAVIEAARALGCDVVLSEDLQHGQDFAGVTVRNPFR